MNQGILILVEHDNQQLNTVTHHVLSAARQLPGEITLLIIGYQCENVAKMASRLSGISRVCMVDTPSFQHGLAENIAPCIAEVGKTFAYIMAGSTTYGKNILPRAAALLGVAQISDIIGVVAPDIFTRPIYAGNAIETVQSLDTIKVLTVHATAFEKMSESDKTVSIEKLSNIFDTKLSNFVSLESHASKRPELVSARVIIAGGRGLQSADNFKLLEAIADKLGAAIGATRAAVDAGFISNGYQIGQTGKVVAPDLYIAVGISGAIQHLAGMKESKVIVAINKDADAPIFEVADYGLVGDLFTILPELNQAL